MRRIDERPVLRCAVCAVALYWMGIFVGSAVMCGVCFRSDGTRSMDGEWAQSICVSSRLRATACNSIHAGKIWWKMEWSGVLWWPGNRWRQESGSDIWFR